MRTRGGMIETELLTALSLYLSLLLFNFSFQYPFLFIYSDLKNIFSHKAEIIAILVKCMIQDHFINSGMKQNLTRVKIKSLKTSGVHSTEKNSNHTLSVSIYSLNTK